MTRSRDLLRALRVAPADDGLVMWREVGPRLNGGVLRLGVDSSSLPILAIPLDASSPEVFDNRSQGFEVRTIPAGLMDGEGPTATVRCLSRSLETPFLLLCDDLIEALAQPKAPTADAIRRIVNRWRHFLAPVAGARLSDAQLMGVLAELNLLEELVVHYGPDRAIEFWQGPLGGRHDFIGSKCSVEVKATTRLDQFAISINGIHQLEPPQGGLLFLYAEQMEPSASGDSVPDIIDRLIDAGVDPTRCLDLLTNIGFRWTDSDEYRGVRFTVRNRVIHAVAGNFPAITPSSMQDPSTLERVIRIDYTVTLDGLDGIRGDEARVCAARELAS